MQLSNPYAWVLLFTSLIPGVLMLALWRRRNAPGVSALLCILLGTTIWAFYYGLQLFMVEQAQMLFLTKLVYIGVVSVSTSLLIFSLEYTGQARRVSKRLLLLLLIEPAAMLLLVWTNEYHHLIYQKIGVVTQAGFVYLVALQRGPAFWVHTSYSYLALGMATVLLMRTVIRSPFLYRAQVSLMVFAVAAAWTGNIIHILVPSLLVDVTPISFMIVGLALTVGIMRFRLFNVVPVARDLVIESLEDAVVVMDDLGRIVDVNRYARTLLALDGKELVGLPSQQVFAPWGNRLTPYLTSEAMRGEVNLGAPEQPHWYDLRMSLVRSQPVEQPLGRALIFHDIQERKRAEEMMAEARDQALQASLAKSQLIANVSHDLRTPINAILGFCEMLMDDESDPLTPAQARGIQQMYQASQQVNLFVSDLLDQSLIEKGKLTLYPSDFQPAELLGSINSIFGHQAMDKGLLFQCESEPGMPVSLCGDVKRLQQILMNLVGNAIKFTDRGFVSVHLYDPGDGNWVMQVTDSGRGIPADAHQYIFEPFRQVDGSARKQSGTGLGLAIARYLVMMMGGRIELESQVGRGSTFRVILPLVRSMEMAQKDFNVD